MTTNPFAQLETSLEEIRLKLDYLASEPKQAEFLTVQQACQLLNISKSTIYKRTMNSEIPFYKHGKKLIFNRLELINYISQHRNHKPVFQGVTIER